MVNEELKTYLILKYGGIDKMYALWLTHKLRDLSADEEFIIADHLSSTPEMMAKIRSIVHPDI